MGLGGPRVGWRTASMPRAAIHRALEGGSAHLRPGVTGYNKLADGWLADCGVVGRGWCP